MDDERVAFIEKARADAASTRAEMEQAFAERQALFDSGKLREVKPPEIKQRSAAAVPGVVYKTKLDATVPINHDAAWNAWVDNKIDKAMTTVVTVIAEEVAIIENGIMEKLISKLYEEAAKLGIKRQK
jgi:hypothetical protein